MNWEEIGAIGQMLGSIAVLVTLGYLAVQQRDTRRELQRSISPSRSDASRELMMTLATDERLNRIGYRVNTTLGVNPLSDLATTLVQKGMTAEDVSAWIALEFAWWLTRSQTITFIDEIPCGERFQFDEGTRLNYGSPGRSRVWYESFKDRLNPDAVRYVDNLLTQPATTPS